jgi:NAD(P)-dependent dehydrogenase (short-subunit alcohol dehydrogenase family)
VPPRRPTALVTGASRGIGRAIAIALARHGYDVAITARTIREGDGRSHDTPGALPGSLESTAESVRSTGATCVPIPLDLLELDHLADAARAAADGLGGRLDVCVNNAIYVGPGNDALVADAEPAEIERRVTGNVTAQLLLTQAVLHRMLAQPAIDGVRGTFVDITSAAGRRTPSAPVGQGGWALTYAVTKAGFHRIADMLAVEYGHDGIRAYNLNPGFVATERVLAAEHLRFVAEQGVAPAVVGDAVVRLLADPPANGSFVHAEELVG